MELTSLTDLFLDELWLFYDAEKQAADVPREMIRSVCCRELLEELRAHTSQTRIHVDGLRTIYDSSRDQRGESRPI
jgi:ferritin-like metal-binding protein YciE